VREEYAVGDGLSMKLVPAIYQVISRVITVPSSRFKVAQHMLSGCYKQKPLAQARAFCRSVWDAESATLTRSDEAHVAKLE